MTDPTPEEIRQECLRIQAEWTTDIWLKRGTLRDRSYVTLTCMDCGEPFQGKNGKRCVDCQHARDLYFKRQRRRRHENSK